MKNNYINYFLVIVTGLIGFTANSQVTYDYSGVEETYVVPSGITLIHIEVKGAKGMDGLAGGVGGNGAFMSGDFVVTPGEVLKVYAGGNPAGTQTGGDGSYVGHEDDTPMIVGGGGGSGTYTGVGGGAVITEDGMAPPVHIGGDGGTAGGGGIAGTGEWGSGGGGGWYSAGTDGDVISGTPGGEAHCMASGGTTYAGGAGGGYSGGGGVNMGPGEGFGGGGAGGSYNSGADQVNTAASNAGLGQVEITDLCNDLLIEVSDFDVCLDQEVMLEAGSITGGTVIWSDGVENGVPFIPDGIGTHSYTATSTSGADCSVTLDIEVHEVPTIESFVSTEELIGGDGLIDITVTGGTPAYDFDWDNDGLGEWGDNEDLTGLAGGTYTVIIADANGCEDTETIVVDSQLGVDSDKKVELSLYPNPTNNLVTIQLEGAFNYTISSTSGQVIMNGNGNTSKTFSMSEQPAGIYFVTVNSSLGTKVLKLVKN